MTEAATAALPVPAQALMIALVLLLQAGAASSTDDMTAYEVSGEPDRSEAAAAADAALVPSIPSEQTEAAIFALFLLAGAIASALIGMGLLALTFMELRLLKRYRDVGLKVRAVVFSAEFMRLARPTTAASSSSCGSYMGRCYVSGTSASNDDVRGGCKGDGEYDSGLDQEEYAAVIDYRLPETFVGGGSQAFLDEACEAYCRLASTECPPPLDRSGCSLAVRKQVIVRGSDFVSSSTSCCNNTTRVQVDLLNSSGTEAAFPTSFLPAPIPALQRRDSSHLYLEVLVMPGHKKSAMPSGQVQRMLRWSHRIPSLVVAFGLLLLSAVAVFLGIRAAASAAGADKAETHDNVTVFSSSSSSPALAIIAAATTGNLLLSGAAAYCCFSSWIEQVLKAEYLESQHDVLTPPLEDSYSIESGEDAYLAI
jgi:hypothetical protein